MLDDFREDPARYRHDPLGPIAIAEYCSYAFFERKRDMSYPVGSRDAGVETSLLDMLGGNPVGVAAAYENTGNSSMRQFSQAFMTAAKLFKAIDAPTEGVIVPHGRGGREIIARLRETRHSSARRELLKRAQLYTVNLLPAGLQAMERAHAVELLDDVLGIRCLHQSYYDSAVGIVADPIIDPERNVW